MSALRSLDEPYVFTVNLLGYLRERGMKNVALKGDDSKSDEDTDDRLPLLLVKDAA